VDHHFILEVSDVLNWVTHSEVVIESKSRKFSWELTLLDLFEERKIVDFVIGLGGPTTWPPRCAFGSARRGQGDWKLVVPELVLSLCQIVLEGWDLGHELLTKQSQLLLLLEDILAIDICS